MSEFVEPDVERIPLSGNNRWIEVKKLLNAGEERRILGRMAPNLVAGEKVKLDPNQVGLAKIVEYLIGWSFTDKQGVSVPVSEAAINNLKPSTYKEIMEAVDAHEAAQEKVTESNLKNSNGADGSKAISESAAP